MFCICISFFLHNNNDEEKCNPAHYSIDYYKKNRHIKAWSIDCVNITGYPQK